MSSKIQQLEARIRAIDVRISDLQKQRRAIEHQKRQEEEQDLLRTLRSQKLSREEILAMIREYNARRAPRQPPRNRAPATTGCR